MDFSLKKDKQKPRSSRHLFPLETVACLLSTVQGHAVWSSDQLMSEERSLKGSLIGGFTNKGVIKFIFFESGQIIEYI